MLFVKIGFDVPLPRRKTRKEEKIILSIFGKKTTEETKASDISSLPKAVAFVDYEHWYISLKQNYSMQPNIKDWFEDLNKHYNLVDVMFFADFSHKSLANEIGRIRLYSNKIIDTRSPSGVVKDFTDFIILDNIYQRALSSGDIDVFILFSGDGHFGSVTSFLKNFYHKEVVIYGINGSFSKSLQETATKVITLPTDEEIHGAYYKYIFKYLRESRRPTYHEAISFVTKSMHGASKNTADEALKKLIENGCVSERQLQGRNSRGKPTKQPVLFIDWEKSHEFYNENAE